MLSTCLGVCWAPVRACGSHQKTNPYSRPTSHAIRIFPPHSIPTESFVIFELVNDDRLYRSSYTAHWFGNCWRFLLYWRHAREPSWKPHRRVFCIWFDPNMNVEPFAEFQKHIHLHEDWCKHFFQTWALTVTPNLVLWWLRPPKGLRNHAVTPYTPGSDRQTVTP